MLLIWGEHEGREQKAFARAISVVGIIAICIQGVASLLGWLGGTATHAPITMQALIYGSSIAGFTGILLWYYRFLRKQGHKATLVGYGLAALLVIVATILGDEFALSTGILIFAHGYTILTDLIYAIFLLCVPIILFEAFVKLQRYTA